MSCTYIMPGGQLMGCEGWLHPNVMSNAGKCRIIWSVLYEDENHQTLGVKKMTVFLFAFTIFATASNTSTPKWNILSYLFIFIFHFPLPGHQSELECTYIYLIWKDIYLLWRHYINNSMLLAHDGGTWNATSTNTEHLLICRRLYLTPLSHSTTL